MISDNERVAAAFAAIGGMDKAVVEMAKAVQAAATDTNKGDEAIIDILTAYQDLHTETLRIVAEAAP